MWNKSCWSRPTIFFPRGQVAAQHAVEVEKAQGLGQSVAAAEKAGEAAAVFRILVKAAVDFARRAPPSAQGLRFERSNIVALLHDFDDFENVFGSSEKISVCRAAIWLLTWM